MQVLVQLQETFVELRMSLSSSLVSTEAGEMLVGVFGLDEALDGGLTVIVLEFEHGTLELTDSDSVLELTYTKLTPSS